MKDFKYYIYLASDGIDDYYKFGITDDLLRRANEYNGTTGRLRPVHFKKVFAFKSRSSLKEASEEARNIENKLKERLHEYIQDSRSNQKVYSPKTQNEVFRVTSQSKRIFNSIMKDSNGQLETFDYYNLDEFAYKESVKQAIHEYINEGLNQEKIKELIISSGVGFIKLTTKTKRERKKNLIILNGEMIYFEDKTGKADRFERYCKFKTLMRDAWDEFNKSFEYDVHVINAIEEYQKKGISGKEMEKIVLSHNVGYREFKTKTQKERSIDLMKLNGNMIYWHSKDSIDTRRARYLNFMSALRRHLEDLK